MWILGGQGGAEARRYIGRKQNRKNCGSISRISHAIFEGSYCGVRSNNHHSLSFHTSGRTWPSSTPISA